MTDRTELIATLLNDPNLKSVWVCSPDTIPEWHEKVSILISCFDPNDPNDVEGAGYGYEASGVSFHRIGRKAWDMVVKAYREEPVRRAARYAAHQKEVEAEASSDWTGRPWTGRVAPEDDNAGADSGQWW